MLDIKKCIFVIDSTTTAFMVSLIAKNEAVNCIFERKEGIDTDKAYKLFINFSKSCLNIATYKEINVPNRYFLDETNMFLKYFSLYKFSKEVRQRFKENSECVYVGPCTSSIMTCLTCSPNNIYYLYHGTIDCYIYFKKVENDEYNINNVKKRLKHFIFNKILKLPNSIWNDFFSAQGFSLINMNISNVRWLNYKEFRSGYIEKKLEKLIRMTKSEKWVMFCPIHDIHNKNGISGNITDYNTNNVNFLRRYVSKDENVMIKCHPSIYQMNDIVTNNLGNVMKNELNIVAEDIIKFIPEEIGGSVIPMEVLFRYCDFTKLICIETTTLWALKDDHDVLKICDYSSLVGKRKELLEDIIQCFFKRGMVDKSYVINAHMSTYDG